MLKLEKLSSKEKEQDMNAKEEYVAVGLAAKLCHASAQTIQRCFDKGILWGVRLGRARLISRKALANYLNAQGLPLGELEKKMARILLVARDRALVEKIRAALDPAWPFELAIAESGFEAGILAKDIEPVCFAIDFSLGREADWLCKNLRRAGAFAQSLIIAILPEGNMASFDRSNISETVKGPLDAAKFVERLRQLVAH